jgi:hypothetical protein
MKYRNKAGKVSDKPSILDMFERDDIILDKDDLESVLTTYYQRLYCHEHPPTVTITLLHEEKDLLIEVEFFKDESQIPF